MPVGALGDGLPDALRPKASDGNGGLSSPQLGPFPLLAESRRRRRITATSCDTPARFRPAPRGISTTRCLVASCLIQKQEMTRRTRLKASATVADRRDFTRVISFAYTSQPKIEAEL